LVVVRRQDRCDATAAREAAQQMQHYVAGLTVKVAGGLIGKHKLWFADQRTRHGDALLLTA
jgi:hypothetical protein